jgi:FlaA1/EpsC-like NDP-sugar epimerase
VSSLLKALRRHRFFYLSLVDTGCWFAGVISFSFAAYVVAGSSLGDAVARTPWSGALLIATLAASLHIVMGFAVRLHHGRSAIGSLEEMLALGAVVTATGLVVTVLNLAGGRLVPASAPIAATAGSLVLMAWYRAWYRAWLERQLPWPRAAVRSAERRTAGGGGCATPVIVFGAGEAGRQLIGSMMRDPRSTWAPVALLDDDRAKRYRRIRGIPVMGGGDQLVDVAKQTNAEAVVIAIPSATSEKVRAISDLAFEAGIDVKVLPSPADLLDPDRAVIQDVRDVDVTDLLGRHQIDTDIDSIAGYLSGKRVLVTGAGGSIGSELCRQIARFQPDELIMLDRDESALHAVHLSIYGSAMMDSDDVVLADIRDTMYIDALFEQRRPQVVFHAAALKHLPMLEQYPGEAVKTNVWGTLSVLEAAKNHGVERFVNVSTDKAANPCSVLGYSKRLAEGVTAAVAQEADGTFLSVRFGNVLGSRGSVLTAFATQIANGGPVTVTDPDVTRYFMTVQESVQLVIQAAAIGQDGEALVLDMGEPVSIDSVARQLIELSGKEVEIVYTGLRDGEKMHEELWGDGEADLRPVHPRLSHTPVPALDPLDARGLDPWAPREAIVKEFVEAVRSMRPLPARPLSPARGTISA